MAESARNKGFDSKDRQEFWTAFLTRWPLQTLEQLTLQDYTQTEDRENCLSTWVKYGCESLGATHTRGTWYDTIGIFAVPQGMDLSRYLEKGRRLTDADRRYCWRAELGVSPEQAFETLRACIVEIAVQARAGQFDALVQCTKKNWLDMGFAWKLAFLYQNPSQPHLLPFFDAVRDPSYFLWCKTGDASRNLSRSTIEEAITASKQLLDLRGTAGLFDYMDELVALVQAKSHGDDDSDALDATKPLQEKTHGMTNPPHLNQILYGPPGTGKTFSTINAALEILDPSFLLQHAEQRKQLKARFEEFVKAGRIEFVTFHQSFSYEDFVEGLRAGLNDEKQLEYRVEPGVFKRLCDAARPALAVGDVKVSPNARVWKVSIAGTGPSSTKSYCLEHDEARIGWGQTGDLTKNPEATDYYRSLGSGDRGTLRYFAEDIEIGDVVLCIHSAQAIAAVGVVTGDYRFEAAAQLPKGLINDYQHVRPVKWLYKSLNLAIGPINDDKAFTLKTVYQMNRLSWADLQQYLDSQGCQPVSGSTTPTDAAKPYVLVIDEINRGNISRIFGELITLIEPSKRAGADEALQVLLPYSKKLFSVPQNVYLIGTMNTADRSLTGMDVALRRRFVFKEMPPRPELLDEVDVEDVIPVGQLLRVLNQRIEALLDRDHCLGHANFMALRETPTIDCLAQIFRNQVLPLLQEYFFDDWQRIQWVLNDHRKPAALRFVDSTEVDKARLFGRDADVNVAGGAKTWAINEAAFLETESYLATLGPRDGSTDEA